MSFDAYCKIDGIDGEASDKKHEKWVEIVSYSHSIAQQAGQSVGGAGGHVGGRVDPGDLRITKKLDAASPNLARYCCSGKPIATVVLEICAATDKKHTYMKYTLTDVVVSSVEPSGTSSGEDSRPLEQVGFRYAKLAWEYTPYDNKGVAGSAVKSEWDFAGHEGA